MADFMVYQKKLQECGQKMENIFGQMETDRGRIQEISNNLGNYLKARNSDVLYGRLSGVSDELTSEIQNVKKISEVMYKISDRYQETESQLVENPFGKINSMTEGKNVITGSLLSGHKNYTMNDGSTTEADGSILKYYGEFENNLIPKEYDGNLKSEIKAKYGVTVAEGTVKCQDGYYSQSLNAKLLDINSEANMGIKIMQDGKLNPAFTIGVSTGVTALSIEHEQSYGGDNYNMYGKMGGKIADGKLGFDAGFGQVKVKDSEGNEKYEKGVGANVEAKFVAASGTVSGGFTIMGIKIGADITGEAGAIGVDGGFTATKSGVKANIGAAAVFGFDAGISIDWSGFEAPKIPNWMKFWKK